MRNTLATWSSVLGPSEICLIFQKEICTYHLEEDVPYVSFISFQDPKQKRLFDYFHALMDDEDDLLKLVEEGEPPEKRAKTENSWLRVTRQVLCYYTA